MISNRIKTLFSQKTVSNKKQNTSKKEDKIIPLDANTISDKKQHARTDVSGICIRSEAIARIMLFKKQKINSYPQEAEKIQQRAQEICDGFEKKINDIYEFYYEGIDNGFENVVKNGNVVRSFECSNDGTVIVMSEYSEDGKITRVSTFNDDVLSFFEEADEKGKINKCELFDNGIEVSMGFEELPSGNRKAKEMFVFDENGRFSEYIKKYMYNCQQDSCKIKEIFYYGDEGFYKHYAKLQQDMQSDDCKIKDILAYDEDGNLNVRTRNFGSDSQKIYIADKDGKLKKVGK